MKRSFDLCVIFAEMRTGSNHLEALLDGVPGLTGLGEVYNPSFVGKPNAESLFDFDLSRREAAPLELLGSITRETAPNLPILRFFHDHDPRVLEPMLDEPRIAKVILTRNPLDSYLSRKIAAETGQWKMTDARVRKQADIRFEAAEFQTMIDAWQRFSARLRHGLQTRGQTAFELDYEDLDDVGVLTGLLRFLGSEESIDPKASKLKPQNPGGPLIKVMNPKDMEHALSQLDPLGLVRPGRPELLRPAAVKTIAVSGDGSVMLLPVPGVAEAWWRAWLDPETGLSQRDLRQWMRQHPLHEKLSFIQHPLARAHDVFCTMVLPRRPAFSDIRRRLRRRYGLGLPQDWPDPSYALAQHREVFGAFLDFLKSCNAGQTSLVPEPAWTGQLAALQGMASFAIPDRIIRVEALPDAYPAFGATKAPFALADIYDAELENRARDVFRRDYVFFGYSNWDDYAA